MDNENLPPGAVNDTAAVIADLRAQLQQVTAERDRLRVRCAHAGR